MNRSGLRNIVFIFVVSVAASFAAASLSTNSDNGFKHDAQPSRDVHDKLSTTIKITGLAQNLSCSRQTATFGGVFRINVVVLTNRRKPRLPYPRDCLTSCQWVHKHHSPSSLQEEILRIDGPINAATKINYTVALIATTGRIELVVGSEFVSHSFGTQS